METKHYHGKCKSLAEASGLLGKVQLATGWTSSQFLLRLIKEMRVWFWNDPWLRWMHCIATPLAAALQCIFNQFQRNDLRARHLIHCNPALQAIASILEKKAHAFARLTLIMSDLQPGTRQKWPATEPASPHFTFPLRAGLAASERWRWSARPTAVCALPSS